jgi:ATP-binding cassette subfamily B protein
MGSPRSYTARDAFRRALELAEHPYDVDLDAGGETVRLSSAQELAEALTERGVAARVVLFPPGRIAGVPVPAFIDSGSGTWTVVHRHGFFSSVVDETEGGTTSISHRRLTRSRPSVAVEIGSGVKHPLGRLALGVLRREIARVGSVFVIALFLQTLLALTPLMTKLLVDSAVADDSASLLGLLCVSLVTAAALTAALGILRDRTLLYLQYRLEASVTWHFVRRAVGLRIPLIGKRSAGDLFQAYYGLTTAREMVAQGTLPAVFDLVLLLLFAVVITVTAPALGLALFAVACAGVSLAVLLHRRRAAVQRDVIKARSEAGDIFLNAVLGARTVKAIAGERHILRRWRDAFHRELTAMLSQQRLTVTSDVVIMIMIDVMLLVSTAWLGKAALSGALSAGAFIAAIQAVTMSGAAISRIILTYGVILQAAVIAEPTRELLATPLEPRRRALNPGAPHPIVLSDVWFRYDDTSAWVVNGVSLTIPAGAKHHLPGPSGSGKTTLLRLIAGMYGASRGTVRIGAWSPYDARNLVLYLPQFVDLLGGSIMSNLRMLSGNAPVEAIRGAARETGLDEWVSQLPLQYETPILPGGDNVSGGQRQLIALTAVAASSIGTLVLDEPMSNLDSETRRRILESPRLLARTVIYTDHAAAVPR